MITARECIAVHARHRELLGAIAHLERFEAAPPDVWAARGVVRFEGAANEPSGGSGADTEETEWSGDLAEVRRRLAVVRTMEVAFRKRWKLDATPAARAPPWRRALCACCATETPEERLEVSASCGHAAVYGSITPDSPLSVMCRADALSHTDRSLLNCHSLLSRHSAWPLRSLSAAARAREGAA